MSGLVPICATSGCGHEVRYSYRIRGWNTIRAYSCWKPACVAVAALTCSGDFIAVEQISHESET